MNKFAVIVPARGRTHNIERLIKAAASTCADTHMWIAIDDDDQHTFANVDWRLLSSEAVGKFEVHWLICPRLSMNKKLNLVAPAVAENYEYVGFLGDDNVPLTLHWDQKLCDAIGSRPGVSYGDDLIKGADLSTSAVLSGSIIRALGYMTPPALNHLYVDNFWMSIGHQLKNLHYLPDVIVEHRHYTAGKAEKDDQYAFVNSEQMYSDDLRAFQEYTANELDKDVEKVLKYTGQLAGGE
jgi:hypothetical protein